ncbi:MAG TPA: hypothetical protein VGM10_10340 [Actinocrinis sp.]
MEHPSGGDVPIAEQIAQLRVRADAGERDAAGLLGELLAREGDLEGAIQVWTDAYGDESWTTKELAELLAQDGDLIGAVRTWEVCDSVWQNPIGLHAQHLSTLTDEERLEEDDPEDWAFTEWQRLTRLLAERGDEAAAEQLREWHKPAGGSTAAE